MSAFIRVDSQDSFSAQEELDYYGQREVAELNDWHDSLDADFVNRLFDEAAA